MRQTSKKIISLIAVVALTFQLFGGTVLAADYSGHWAEQTIEKWLDYGVISGYPGGAFKANNPVTRAEFVTIINNLFGFEDATGVAYTDVKTTDWYYSSVVNATNSGIIKGYNNAFRPNDLINRQEAAIVLANAFKLSTENDRAYNKFSDSSKVADWASDQVAALVAGGYMNGKGNNMLAPTANLTRAEAVTLMNNIAGVLVNSTDEFTATVKGNAVVTAPNAVLKDAVIDGDLYIAQSVGEGDVTLDGVTVKGQLFVFGGGENSIHLKNTQVEKMVVIKLNGKVRIVAEGDTEVAIAELLSGAKLEEGEGTGEGFGKVEITAIEPGQEVTLAGDYDEVVFGVPVDTVTVTEGTVDKMVFAEGAENTKLVVEDGAVVETLTLNAEDADINVEAGGRIGTIEVEADGVTLVVEDGATVETVEVDEDVDQPEITGKDNVDKVVDEPSSGGSSSGGSSGGGGSTTVEKDMVFDLNGRVVSIRLAENASYTEITEAVLAFVDERNEVSSYYENYKDRINSEIPVMEMGGVNILLYAAEDDLMGTMFEGILDGKDRNDDADRVDVLVAAVGIVKAHVSDMASIENDLKTIADKIALSDATYKGDTYTEANVTRAVFKKGITVLVDTDANATKADFIEAIFTEIQGFTMSTAVEYKTIVTVNGKDKVATFKTSN